MEQPTHTVTIVCPFCGQSDFDLIGLKHHYIMGYCKEYNATPEDYPSKQEISIDKP